jgi:hypothetical protein
MIDSFIVVPKVEHLTGEIEIGRLTYVEKMKLLKELNISYEGEDRKIIINADPIDQIITMKNYVDKKVKRVELEYKGKKITNWSELEYYSFFQEIMNEINSMIFEGAELGND